MRIALVLALSLVTGAAAAEPLTIRHGRAIHVALAERTEQAVALRAANGGWRVDLGRTMTGTLMVRDVTRGVTNTLRFELPLVGGAVTLDEARFRADHAYRVELRRGTAMVGSAVIYLSPPRRGGHVVFDAADAATADDELAPSDKGTL